MGHIESLTKGHIKSCARSEVHSLTIGPKGPEFDRHWMVVDKRTGKFVLSDKKPVMANIHSDIADNELQIEYENSRISVPIHDLGSRTAVEMFEGKRYEAVDDGDEIADWFSQVLGIPVRLVHMPEDGVRLDSQSLAQLGFADSWALTISSLASLADLNQRIEQANHPHVPKERFGHNIWIDGVLPYEEDEWAEIVINGLTLLVVNPVIRCARTLVPREAPENISAKDKEPLRTLSLYRKTDHGVIFGQKIAHQGEGEISVGDEIVVARRKLSPDFIG